MKRSTKAKRNRARIHFFEIRSSIETAEPEGIFISPNQHPLTKPVKPTRTRPAGGRCKEKIAVDSFGVSGVNYKNKARNQKGVCAGWIADLPQSPLGAG